MNRIVGIGEVLWDVFPDGRKVAGGAPFNFAFHCHQLGHPAVIVSRVGDDALGRELRDEVRRLGLSDEYIQNDPDHPTGTVQVSVDAAGQPSYTITEDVAWDYIEYRPQMAVLSEFTVAACYGTLAQRTKPSESAISEFIKTARGLRVFDVNLRPGGVCPEVLSACLFRAHWVKFNRQEMRLLLWQFGVPDAEQSGSISQLVPCFQPYGHCPTCILTTGEGSAVLQVSDHGTAGFHDRCEVFTEAATFARVVDTVGAGDSFTAAMVCLHLEGRPLRECVRFANHYAARVCEHRGATPRIDRAEVERAAFGTP